jgi:hypothetical protein
MGNVAFTPWAATVAGLCAGLAMMLVPISIRGLHLAASQVIPEEKVDELLPAPRLDIPLMWGTLLGLFEDQARVAGFFIHLLVSVLVAYLYAWIFDWLGAWHALWIWGMFIGFVQYFLVGILFGYLPWIHPRINDGDIAPPGIYAWLYGAVDAWNFLLSHLMYGFCVGFIYAYLATGTGVTAWAIRPPAG